jgi:uncharacterized protein YkwD
MRRAIAFAVLVFSVSVALVSLAPEARADANDNRFVVLTNGDRANGGLPALAVASDLVNVARGQANRMAAQHRLYHNPNLATEVSNWKKVGENVGVGADPDSIELAFMASSVHRSHIMSTEYTEFGAGTAMSDDGRLYVSVVFRLPMQDAPAPPPDAAPPPDSAPVPVPVVVARPLARAPAPAPEPPPAPEPLPAPVAAPVATTTTLVFGTPMSRSETPSFRGQVVAAVAATQRKPAHQWSNVAWAAAVLAAVVLCAHVAMLHRREVRRA